MRILGVGGPYGSAPATRRVASDRREPEILESRALIAVDAGAPSERAWVMTRHPGAPFLAHLIATEMQAPQTRARRRAEPEEAGRGVSGADRAAFAGGAGAAPRHLIDAPRALPVVAQLCYNSGNEDMNMRKTQTIRARVEPALKRDAEAVLRKIGLTSSEAITLFLTQVRLTKGIPFPLRIPNKQTERAIRETRERKNVETFEHGRGLGEESPFVLTFHAPCYPARAVSRRPAASDAARAEYRRTDRRGRTARRGWRIAVRIPPAPADRRVKGIWECHIEPDWLLIYDVTPDEVRLIRTGTHSDLFG